jgi:hypothetical protein
VRKRVSESPLRSPTRRSNAVRDLGIITAAFQQPNIMIRFHLASSEFRLISGGGRLPLPIDRAAVVFSLPAAVFGGIGQGAPRPIPMVPLLRIRGLMPIGAMTRKKAAAVFFPCRPFVLLTCGRCLSLNFAPLTSDAYRPH